MKQLSDLRVVFFGTPDFAVASLRAMVEAGVQVLAVVTAPDKPAGRGLQLRPTPVKEYAQLQGLPVLQPPKLKAPEFIAALQDLNADLHVVVAFRMLPEAVWAMPPLGTINVHGSLLPQYRGAAPINWAIINGETETGVTTFRLKHEIDTGNMLLQDRVEILDADDAGTVHDKLMEAGARLLVRTLEGLVHNAIEAQPQPEGAGLKHAPKLFREHMVVDWNQPVAQIRNLVRGLSPYPGAMTTLQGKGLKLYSVDAVPGEAPAPGTIDTDGKSMLRFAGADGWIQVLDLQLEGKKRMSVTDFLRGFRF